MSANKHVWDATVTAWLPCGCAGEDRGMLAKQDDTGDDGNDDGNDALVTAIAQIAFDVGTDCYTLHLSPQCVDEAGIKDCSWVYVSLSPHRLPIIPNPLCFEAV